MWKYAPPNPNPNVNPDPDPNHDPNLKGSVGLDSKADAFEQGLFLTLNYPEPDPDPDLDPDRNGKCVNAKPAVTITTIIT